MKNKITLSAAIIIALNLLAVHGFAQNVGVGQSGPASKLDIKGNLTVGSTYSGTAAPANGAIIQGNVGIGNSSPSALLTIGSSAPVTVDASGNVKISSLTSARILMTGTGGLVSTVTAPSVSNTFLQWNGSAFTWATAASTLANLSPGTGLSGSAYNGNSAASWSVSYGNTSGTAVQGNTQVTVNPGTGLSGGGTITLGSGGTVSLANTGVLSASVTSPIVNTGSSTALNIALGTVGVANGGTGLTSYTAGSILDASSSSATGQIADVASGSYLRSAGVGNVPVWSTLTLPNAATTGDILFASGTNTIGNLSDAATGNVLISGGASTAPTWGKVSLTAAVSGILPIANGGTNSGTALSGSGIMISNGSQIVQGTAGTTTTVLHGNASGAPTYSAVNLSSGGDATGTLPASNGGTGLSSYTAGSLLDASSSSAVGQITDVTAGSYLRSNGAGNVPVWSTLTLPNAATTGDLLFASGSNAIGNLSDIATGNVLISGGTSVAPSWGKVGLTSAVSGILPIANGGTNLSTAPSNGQLLIGNGSGYTLGTITAGTGITITNASGAITIAYSGSGSSQWTTSGANIYNNNTGNVGINTSSPKTILDVNGNMALRENVIAAGSYGSSYALNPNGYSFCVLQPTASFTLANITAGNDGQILIVWSNSSSHGMTISSSGNIQTYTGSSVSPSSGQMTMATFIWEASTSQWIMVAYQ